MSGAVRRTRVNNDPEKIIVTGMIVSDRYIKGCAEMYDPAYLKMPYARTVAGWCMEYYEAYGKAPGKHIRDIYESKTRAGLTPEVADVISTFLVGLSGDYERGDAFNAEYALDQTSARFRTRQLEMLSEDIGANLASSNPDAALHSVATFRLRDRVESMGVNPFDPAVIEAAFAENSGDLVLRLPGALGEFVGDLRRSELISVMGPEKRGKTWNLQEMGIIATRQRRNVAFFPVGDMTEKQLVRRHAQRIARRARPGHGGWLDVPVADCVHNQTGRCGLPQRAGNVAILRESATGDFLRMPWDEVPNGYAPCVACRNVVDADGTWRGAVFVRKVLIEDLDLEFAKAASARFERKFQRTWRIKDYPNGTATVKGIEQQLDIWEDAEGFVPDMVIIDYADIMGTESNRWGGEYRHTINETWMAMKALSQRRNCLVVTATQADAKAHTVELIQVSNFSEDKRKYSHVNQVLTLNQTPQEKRDKVMRYGRMMVREDDFDPYATVTVLQSLATGQPYLDSFYTHRERGV